MSFSGGGMLGGSPSPVPSHTPLFLLREGISLVLSRWEALQVAIRNQWGGGDSHQKHDELVSFILTFFSRPDVCVDDLEHALEEKMVLSFNTMVDDGSVEEVAEQLMIMYEECLHGNFEVIEKLKSTHA
ncbi:pre-rRNA-processing protein TSR2-like [Zingiber officinale]|uniref:pre-rRNA-processing protein TSR2-like n=1 Tax=Zingiber officinale TaxID=94328 RepID=UPI001C4DD613|nr:pre-rRNA-processing protein TSR2-like [Zingiber officinale]